MHHFGTSRTPIIVESYFYFLLKLYKIEVALKVFLV
jgi:hypothetical protein